MSQGTDAGRIDAGTPNPRSDAGRPTVDAGRPNPGNDAGRPNPGNDAGRPAADAGRPNPGNDAGRPVTDGGRPSPDAGQPDAGQPSPDAGQPSPGDASVTATDSGPPAPVEGPGLEGTLAEHNRVRAEHGLPPLTWDPDLAAIAAAWVAQCIDQDSVRGLVDHNPGRSDNYPGYVGENIYGSSGRATGVAATRSWAAEEMHYDYANNTCSRVCGHYTQIVWRETTRVGCAIGNCPGLTYGSTIVCNYAPGGNISGRRPY